jgi:hypothetical protein
MCHPCLLVADVHHCLESVRRGFVDGPGTVAAVVVGRSSFRFQVPQLPLVAGTEAVVGPSWRKSVVLKLLSTLEGQDLPWLLAV